MHDPILEEICRADAGSIRPEAFKRWQRHAREVLDPALGRLAELEAENTARRAPRKGEA